jgi:hypothetical protein
MAETKVTNEQSEKTADDMREWKNEFEGEAQRAQLTATALFVTFEKLEPEAFIDLEYAESIWFLVGQLQNHATELDQLMQRHVIPLREKAGLVESKKRDAQNESRF